MSFTELAEYLDKLEKISSRLEMTRILAELLTKVTPEEGKIIAYLSQGLLGPRYDNPDTGMGEKQVVKAIKLISDQAIEEIFKKEGDLGRTVEKVKRLSPSAMLRIKRLSVDEVYEKLVKIAKVSGSGSVDEKTKLLSDLVIELDPVGAKYAVKMILGKLRTGFSDMTVLDALSYMIAGDKSLRVNIEQIYNVRADLGEVVKLIKRLSDQEIKRLSIDPVVGTPVLVARAERAKTVAEIWERVGPAAAAEHKLDGLRIQAHINYSVLNAQCSVKLFSRGMENVTAMYPDIVEGLKKQINIDCILDGEMIAVGDDGKYRPFQETVQRKRKYDIEEMMTSVPLKYYVFDVLSAEGKNFLEDANEKRWEELKNIVNNGDVVRLMPRIIVKSEEEIQEFFDEALADGTEGIVVKKLDGTYKSGSRDFTWIKYKKSYDASAMADTVDAVIMGYDAGQGKRAGFGIGDFLIGVYDDKSESFKTIAKIGTGLTDEEWRQVKTQCSVLSTQKKPEGYEVTKQMECDHWVKPKVVVEVLADEITKSPMHTSGLALRFPRLISFREKKPEDATTIQELKKLFEMQSSTT